MDTQQNTVASPEAPVPATSTHEEILLQWSGSTHPVHERGPRWYLYGGIAVLVMAAYGIVTGTWTLALLTILIGGAYYLVRREPPVMRDVAITTHGFRYGTDFAHWDECKDFWLIRTPGYWELHVRRGRGINRELIVQTGDINPNAIRATLSHYLPLRPDQKERMVDLCIRFLKL
jgi:hypothetical protein